MDQIQNPVEKAIELSGGLARLAAAIGKSQQAVSNWRSRGVPTECCPAIERATDGAVRCEELRPDVDWDYLRGTSKEAA